MKALSLWQPWAAAIALGAKAWETRGYATNYRGVLAIHAAKRDPLTVMDAEQLAEYCDRLRHAEPLRAFRQCLDARGAIVAIARLTECRRASDAVQLIAPAETFWGDFNAGRYAWKLDGIVVLDHPVPVRGQQMIWTLAQAEAAAVEAALPRGVAA